MKFLRKFLDAQEKHFVKGGKLEKLYPLYEALDTFLYTPASITKHAPYVRDMLDSKRMMITVVWAMIPAILMALYNTGYQANLAMAAKGITSASGWRGEVINALGTGYNANSILSNFVHGLLYFLPVFLVTNIVGGFWEVLFAIVRKHEINEGFLVTGMLFPMILPPTIPLWQVAVGISFGVVLGKEVFGGTGMNFLNPALVGRAFLFFAYPANMSGNAVWVAVDGYTAATPLGIAAQSGLTAVTQTLTWKDAFLGFMPGSMGETSALAALLGAAYLIYTGIGSWRVMVSVVAGLAVTVFTLNAIGSDTNPMFALPFHWHLVLGGFMFGTVFMATDPVSAAQTNTGRYIYGFLIGFMVALIRVINPAFPEGMMLAILFGNVFAPIIDWFVIQKNIKRRKLKSAS
ncbi:MAG: NADH:ubiquinone reductase (Na(+)-transporting) subunit B [Candidatus Hydrogenedentota bacterium]|nr:MAG: NADH:ubiquinone reductase (Na(+)-transporting) subunit B [Candidatus Hydrogenedentota bacterium]